MKVEPGGERTMERVLIFGNTKEALEEAAMLRRRGRQIVFSVVSEYGRSLLPLGSMCHVGRLDLPAMLDFVRKVNPQRIVDASHPYAVLASQNVRQCAETLNIPYERIRFADLEKAWRDAVEWVDSHEALVAAILREKGNMLLSIDSDPLLPIPLDTDMHRLYPRVSPTPEAVARCLELGYPHENIIAMDGPFSRAMTMALFDEKNITSVVVRDATDKSYLHEMVVPALEQGFHVIMYGRK